MLLANCLDQEMLDYEMKKLQSYVKEKTFIISEKGALADKVSPGIVRSMVALSDMPQQIFVFLLLVDMDHVVALETRVVSFFSFPFHSLSFFPKMIFCHVGNLQALCKLLVLFGEDCR
jgi:hypothetical protein